MLGLGPFGNTRDLPPFGAPFVAPFALRCRVSFLNRETMARIFAARAAPLREFRPILPAFAIIVPEGGQSGSKAMEWFKRKTSIAGYEISNWIIVLGVIIVALLIFQNLH